MLDLLQVQTSGTYFTSDLFKAYLKRKNQITNHHSNTANAKATILTIWIRKSDEFSNTNTYNGLEVKWTMKKWCSQISSKHDQVATQLLFYRKIVLFKIEGRSTRKKNKKIAHDTKKKWRTRDPPRKIYILNTK